MKKINKQSMMYFLLILQSLNYSCKNFLDIEPPKDSIIPQLVFNNDESATAAINGIYTRMSAFGGFSGNQNSISVIAGLSADEFISYNPFLDFYYQNSIPSSESVIDSYLWTESYSYIYTANLILQGIESSSGMSENTDKQLRGEAKFVRAFCYFYLVNLFGEVPLNLSPDYKSNELKGRSTIDAIYRQITTDLIDAENLLPINFVTSERVRPSKWSVKALLSRVYLYTGNWEMAALKATEVIDQKATFELLTNLNQVFLKNSKEAIWQLMPTAANNTKEGALFILNATPTQISLSSDLISSIDPDDNRRTNWIGEYTSNTEKYYYPLKYKIKNTVNNAINEYSMVFRLAELYLIRAEARARLMQPELALNDINLLRARAGLLIPLEGLNESQCILEIERQRRIELFSEWGHRWLDLKRYGRATSVLSHLKGATWSDYDILYPIPDNEINRNPFVEQNPGY